MTVKPYMNQNLRRFRICGQIRAGYRISGQALQVGNPDRPDPITEIGTKF